MTDPGYNLVEIVDAVRRAGNPQKAALEALADTDGLTDAALLDALPYDTYEAAAAPFEALRDRLTAALELGRWPEQ